MKLFDWFKNPFKSEPAKPEAKPESSSSPVPKQSTQEMRSAIADMEKSVKTIPGKDPVMVGPRKPGQTAADYLKRWNEAHMQSTSAAVLQDHVALPATAVAFARRRSPLLHALQHAGARQTVAVDIHDYFGSVSAGQVRDALREEHEGPCKGWSEAGMDRLLSVVTIGHPSRHIRYLPQGASSSPRLANLVGLQLDRVVRHKVGERPWRGAWQYSRYADDLVLSVPADERGHDFHDDARKLLHDSIRALRWIPAPGKTRHFSSARGIAFTLCGLQVPADPDERPRLPREVERRVRAAHLNARRGEVSSAARGLLAYAYSMTGRHALAAALPGEARRLD